MQVQAVHKAIGQVVEEGRETRVQGTKRMDLIRKTSPGHLVSVFALTLKLTELCDFEVIA